MSGRERWAIRYEMVSGFGVAWIVSIVALAAIIYPVSVAAWYNNLGNSNADWVHHLFLRKEAAMQFAGSAPRILIVGGSGCLFSVDAEVLQRELRQPVINLCSHAGVGLEYMLARARRHARANDTVLLVPEYRVLAVPDPAQRSIEWAYFTTWDRRHYLEHGLPEAYRMLYRIPFADLWRSRERWTRWSNGYEPQLTTIYDVTTMTPNGDLHESIGKAPSLAGVLDTAFLPPSDLARQWIDEFALWCRSHDVNLIAAFQPAALDPSDHWRKKELFAMLPQWWKDRGVETLGTPDEALWPNAGFMDSVQHAGPGVSYSAAVRIARALRKDNSSRERLLVPPHPAQSLLPLPSRPGADVRVHFGTPEDDSAIREFQKGGGRVFVATSALADQLRGRGYQIKPIVNETVTPAAVLQANRDKLVAVCARPDAPAIPGLDPVSTGAAWTGLWEQGRWNGNGGGQEAAWSQQIALPLATAESIAYQFALRATRSACEMQFQKRDRAPAPDAVIRMIVLDPERGILRGIYNFGPSLQAEKQWVGEVGPL